VLQKEKLRDDIMAELEEVLVFFPSTSSESPELKFHAIHTHSGKVEDYVIPSGTRKRLIAFHEKRVKDLKEVDKEIVKAAEKLLTYENIYSEKSPDIHFTTSAERAKLRSKSALKQIKLLANLYNKRGQIILKKSEGKYHGNINAFGEWSLESSPESSSKSLSKSSTSDNITSFKPFQTVKLDALKKPLEKSSVEHSANDKAIENAIHIAKQNMVIIQQELVELQNLHPVSFMKK
jgi:hypothetical protein